MGAVLVYLGRFAIILLGYLASALAASAFLHVVSLGALGFSADEAPFVMMGSIVFSIPFIALFVAYFAFIPSAGAILIAEILGVRDWLFYAIAGAVVAMIVIGFFWHAADAIYEVSEGLDLGRPPADANSAISDPRLAMAVIGGGVVAGIVYWLAAGRLAGNWRGRVGEKSTSPAPSGS